ncbi:hypothetical protein JKF63_07040 [Porcisia hertigi]|uniref:Uncharacterized protein n=1 Tax=Porcisia hertigi TaxID=2761500 RepID=A0A836IID2_9TRYP|nr:hypothetical protein JKF63_07040 [Porcisia hertigi]
MRGGGFGRYGYDKPQPGLQFHSYEDATYPPRAYRYHIQQAALPPTTSRAAGGSGGGGGGANSTHSAEALAETTIVLPTIDADAACGPFAKSGNPGDAQAMSAASSSVGYVRGSASSSNTEGGFSPRAGGGAEAERRPPPRLRYFLDCFVPDEGATDVQTLCEAWRHMEPLNPFHYRELWGGMDGNDADTTTDGSAGRVKSEPLAEWNTFADGGIVTSGSALKAGSSSVKGEAQDVTPQSFPTQVAGGAALTRGAYNALQRTVRAVGLPDELSSMVLLSVRIPPGARLTRKQEKVLRLRAPRHPAPPRPIRRGAKVFVPVAAVINGAPEHRAPVRGTGGGGLLDVTALGPRVMRLASGSPIDAAAGAGSAGAVVGEFAFDDDDEDEKNLHNSPRGSRAGVKRGRHGVEGKDLDAGDIPLIASGRWGLGGGAGNGVEGSAGGPAPSDAAGGAVRAHGDEVGGDNEDDFLSTGTVDDDDDENLGSEDDQPEDDESFGGGDDGDDSY